MFYFPLFSCFFRRKQRIRRFLSLLYWTNILGLLCICWLTHIVYIMPESVACARRNWFPIPLKLNGIWWCFLFFFCLVTERNSCWFLIKIKLVSTIIFHLIWKENRNWFLEIYFNNVYRKMIITSYTSIRWFRLRWENYTSIFFHIEWDIIAVTVFLSILKQMEFHLVQNRKEYCHHGHIPFNVKGNGNIIFSV